MFRKNYIVFLCLRKYSLYNMIPSLSPHIPHISTNLPTYPHISYGYHISYPHLHQPTHISTNIIWISYPHTHISTTLPHIHKPITLQRSCFFKLPWWTSWKTWMLNFYYILDLFMFTNIAILYLSWLIKEFSLVFIG